MVGGVGAERPNLGVIYLAGSRASFIADESEMIQGHGASQTQTQAVPPTKTFNR